MKKLLAGIGFTLFIIAGSTFASNAQVIVKVKPANPNVVVVKPARVRPHHIWVAGHWKWNSRKHVYVWTDGHYVKKRRGHRYVEGHWMVVAQGYKWVPGTWVRA